MWFLVILLMILFLKLGVQFSRVSRFGRRLFLLLALSSFGACFIVRFLRILRYVSEVIFLHLVVGFVMLQRKT